MLRCYENMCTRFKHPLSFLSEVTSPDVTHRQASDLETSTFDLLQNVCTSWCCTRLAVLMFVPFTRKLWHISPLRFVYSCDLDLWLCMPLPPLNRCWKHYVFRLSVSVRATVCIPKVCLSYKLLVEFHQTYKFTALGDNNELIRF